MEQSQSPQLQFTPLAARKRLLAQWKRYGSVPGDPRAYIERVWSKRLPRIYECMLGELRENVPINPLAFDLLRAMTIMCRTLAPQASKVVQPDPIALGLPSDADLSHLSDEDLARVLRRPLPGPDVGKPARKPRRKALPQPDVPMGGLGDDDDEIRSGTQHTQGLGGGTSHTHESKVSKGGKKK